MEHQDIADNVRSPPRMVMENTTYWRGKVKVFEHWKGDGSKHYTAQYCKLRYWTFLGVRRVWDHVTHGNINSRVFDTADAACAAAKEMWEVSQSVAETHVQKVWP